MRGAGGVLLGSILVIAISANEASGVNADEAHRSVIVWLETHQNLDGSWGSGLTQPVATAEALLALARAGRPRGPAAQKAAAWLLTRSYTSLDHRARAVRALTTAGFSTGSLASFGSPAVGWGPVATDSGVTSYDSALVAAAVALTGQAAGSTPATATVLSRRRPTPDWGWSGDFVPTAMGPSDLTVTAEILRALVPALGATGVNETADRLGNSPYTAATTLEVAARLAALHAYQRVSDPIETNLLGRVANGSWGSDPLVNALGLLAISTRPGRTLGGGPAANDDGDAYPNASDAFPQDPLEWLDSDGDGVGDQADADDDGDGVCEGAVAHPGQCSRAGDAFALDPREWTDTDGDGTGDNTDTDADGDGVPDETELEAGSDPSRRDTDGDGLCDKLQASPPCAKDPCPTVAFAQDLDEDGFCSDRDECDLDPADWRDTDDDDVCDLADADDDGDLVSDLDELAAGTDPRNPASVPGSLAVTDPTGDFDDDGLTNAAEKNVHGTSLFLADTDQDGATDLAEASSGSALNPAVRPVPAPGVFAVFGAFVPSGSTHLAETNPASIRATGTGGQPTPVSHLGGSLALPSASQGYENLAGFQPQCTIGRDLDGDGLIGLVEASRRTSFARVDTDEDGFADGSGGVVPIAGYSGLAWDLQPDGFLDGEDDHDTDPSDADDHPGEPGDVAPLGLPDGRITAADATVELQIVADPNRTATLSGQRKLIADQASDAEPNGVVDVRDALRVVKEAGSAP